MELNTFILNPCPRCGNTTLPKIESMFDISMICTNCQVREKAHPDYKKAVDAEHEAIIKENFNFHGIGKPKDL
jgi:hypothetical protein